MDVTCERCGTEYEFDETLLSARGTSVKCTNCGHVFKVYPRGKADVDRSTSTWQLLRLDGSTETIDSLRELQRRIAMGELVPDDRISRGHEDPKTLGSIPELETFFQAARSPEKTEPLQTPVPPSRPAGAPASTAPRPRQPTLLGVVPVPKHARPTAPTTKLGLGDEPGNDKETTEVLFEPGPTFDEAPGSVRLPESADDSVVAPAEPEESFDLDDIDSQGPTAELSPDDSFRLPEAPPAVSDHAVTDAEFEETSSAPLRATPPPAYFDDDDDIPELPGRGWSPMRWLILAVVLGAVAVVGTQWQQVAHMLGLGTEPAETSKAASEGDAVIAADHVQAYKQAILAYDKAHQGRDDDPELLTKLARAHALTAQALRDQAPPGESPVDDTHARAALRYAEESLMVDAESVEARIAEADALRLRGEYRHARESLERARSMAFSGNAEFYRVDALLQAAEHGDDLAKALLSAQKAVEHAPDGIRYRLLLARAHTAAGNATRARQEVDAVIAIDPHHPTATSLVAAMEATAAPPKEDTDVSEPKTVGEAEAGSAETEAGTPSKAAVAAATELEAASKRQLEADRDPKNESADEDGEKGASAKDEAPPRKEREDKSKRAKKDESADEKSTEGSEGGSAEESAEAPVAEVADKRPAKQARRRRSTPPRLNYDEYDRLAEAAGSDAFVNGRPPVRDFGWYMREGEAALAARDYTKARAFFESALEVRPGSGDATEAIGRVAFASGDYEPSLRYFRSAAQRGHPDGYYNLGRAYEKLGRTDEAVSAYYTYLKRRPSGAHVAQARAAIKKLEPRVKLPEPEPQEATEPPQEPEAASP